MNDYQQEQFDAFTIVRQGLSRMDDSQRRMLKQAAADYMKFRQSVDRFLERYFNPICTDTCFRSQTSACCSKDGIITFFADAVINVLHASPSQMDRLIQVLKQTNSGHRCVYLGEEGCLWGVRPVVCAMFLCDRATNTVFSASPEAGDAWGHLRLQEKRFKWPDRPVLFDYLERVFLDMGYQSTLMHLNMSPGLLRIKRSAGLI